jgi:hydrogenase maturation protease
MRWLVIGIGNPFRRDDGVGINIAERISGLQAAEVEVKIQSGEGAALMESWSGAENVLVVDAVRSNSTPGKIHQIDATRVRVPSEFFHYSSHAFGVAEAIEMARALDQLPKAITVVGIEGKDFSEGIGLSPEVEEAATAATARICRILEGLDT